MKAEHLLLEFHKNHGYLERYGLKVVGLYHEDDYDDGEGLTINIGQSIESEDDIIPEQCHLSVMHPFIFDNRKIPKVYMGVRVLNIVRADTMPSELEEIVYDPAGFEMNYTPGQYFAFIQENMDLIRATLKEPEMSFDEMLDAICFGDFNKFQQEFDEERIKRLTQ